MSDSTNITTDTVWEHAKSMRICMLTSWNGSVQHARPMSSRINKDRHAIYFLDKADSTKEQEMKKFPGVSVSYVDTAANTYVAVAGNAVISNDRTLIKELWSDMDRAYFDSPDDPNIHVIIVTPVSAEVWDGPNRLVAGAKMLMAAATGAKPDMGENRKLAM